MRGNVPRWCNALLAWAAPRDQADEAIGDLEEAHQRRVARRGRRLAGVLTALEAVDVAVALLRERWRRRGTMDGTAARGSFGARISLLDFKLGFRMLAKYPGLTVVGGLAIALGIAVGAFAFELAAQVMHPRLPLPDGDRIVALRLWHRQANGVEEQSLHDFIGWRESVKSIEELGAYRDVDRNLVTRAGQSMALRMAEMTASGFRLAGVRPLLGRVLEESDEQLGAPPVVVIGERVWRTQFNRDPAVLGQTVRLGGVETTMIGVMPESFGFPVFHSAWAPLRIAALDSRPRRGTQLHVFGRLAPGISLDEAQAELRLLGERAAADMPETHEHLRPEVMAYTRAFFTVSWRTVMTSAYAAQLGVLLFLILVCANVATLVFARTAARESEMVLRSALGASRGRIVSQILAETLVLGGVGALVGLSITNFGVRIVLGLLQDAGLRLPFWIRTSLAPTTVLYAVLLTFIAAVIAGAVPALKVTRGLAHRLRQAAVGGADLKFGKLWTGLIVTQVALTVIFMALTIDAQQDMARGHAMRLGFPARQFLSAQLEIDRMTAAAEAAEVPYTEAELAHYRATFDAVEQRLAADPAIATVTYTANFPGSYHTTHRIEVDGASGSSHIVQRARVGLKYFDALGVPPVAGRGFRTGDLGSSAGRPTGDDALGTAVIVNESFVRQVFGGGNPIGRHVRYLCHAEQCGFDRSAARTDKREPWLEIIGIVPDIAMTGDPDLLRMNLPGMYHPWQPGDAYWARIAVRVRGDPRAFAPRLRAITTAVDPSVRIEQVMTLEDLYELELRAYDFAFRGALLASAIVLLLSVAGTYSIMSFTVSRRTREIGIRSALGADPRRIVLAIFSRALAQVMAGVLAGTVLLLVMMRGIQSRQGALIVLLPVCIMLAVCALACVVPTRRALRIEPTAALREG
jgi:putative ABC transport system permease protein